MKKAIIEIDDISESKELYGTYPRVATSVFLYIVLAIVIGGIIYSLCGKIENVVIAQGIVRPGEPVMPVYPLIEGRVVEVYRENGEIVHQGDVILRLDTFETEKHLHSVEKEILQLEEKANQMECYLNVICQICSIFDSIEDKAIIESTLKEVVVSFISETAESLLCEQLNYYTTLYLLTGDYLGFFEQKMAVMTEIDNLTTSVNQLYDQRNELQKQIEYGTIKAETSGVLNYINNVSIGDNIQGGMTMATIIPESENLKVQLYVNGSDIVNVSKGDEVNYVFGNVITHYADGNVINISGDSVLTNGQFSGYFLVDASLNSISYLSEVIDVKPHVGMQVEGRIVFQEETILRYLLEKIKLIE